MLLGLGLVGWGWLGVGCAGRFGVGGLGLVSGGLCFSVWGWWVGVGRSWFVLAGMAWVGWGRSVLVWALGLVGWGWSVVVCAQGFGVGGLRLVSGGLCFWVWGWWVGVGRS